MSIRFDEQPEPRSILTSLKVKRPSRQHRWYVWAPIESRWRPLSQLTEATISGYNLCIDPEVCPGTAAAYLEKILPTCDSYHVLVAYQWTETDHVYVGLVRSRAPFTAGQRLAPDWAIRRKSAWERIGGDDPV